MKTINELTVKELLDMLKTNEVLSLRKNHFQGLRVDVYDPVGGGFHIPNTELPLQELDKWFHWLREERLKKDQPHT